VEPNPLAQATHKAAMSRLKPRRGDRNIVVSELLDRPPEQITFALA
jgi:hypothetical protein